MFDPARVVERARRCQNCISWENEKLARDSWAPHYRAACAHIAITSRQASEYVPASAVLEVSRLAQAGVPEHAAVEQAFRAAAGDKDKRLEQLENFNRKVVAGAIGLCLKGAAEADFCEAGHLCTSWSGRDGWSVAVGSSRLTGKLDKLSDELKDIADSKARGSKW